MTSGYAADPAGVAPGPSRSAVTFLDAREASGRMVKP